jgi:hypothetical protein
MKDALRNTAVVLIVAAALEIPVMAHHPSGRAPDILQTLAQLRAMAGLSAWVHGVLIALMLVVFHGLIEFSLWRGIHLRPIRIALLAYGTGVLAMVAAASISGFVTARMAVLAPDTGPTDLGAIGQILTLCAVLNRTMANLGAVAMSIGIASWSLDLLWGSRVRPAVGAQRATGLLGLAIGLLSVAGLLTGELRLDVHGMLLVVVLQSVWVVALGFLLFFHSPVVAREAGASFQ